MSSNLKGGGSVSWFLTLALREGEQSAWFKNLDPGAL
jgi:hypothetical protein